MRTAYRRRVRPGPDQASLFDDLFGEEDAGPEPAAPSPAAARFRPSGQEDLAPSGAQAKARANLAAIRTLRAIEADRGRLATAGEQAILARWAGWGAIPEVFDDRDTPAARSLAWARRELHTLLTGAERDAAARNTLNAHYTDAAYARAIWDAADAFGFTGGQVLEPGCGSGNFIGFAPESAQVTGVELDPVTAKIAGKLYPQATVYIESFAATRLPAGSFDLVVGNVPFGKFPVPEKDVLWPADGEHSIHNHFLIRSLRLLRPGGMLLALTSRYTLDAESDRARSVMDGLADLVGAVRFPAGAFQQSAGTKVVMDLLILRRREDGQMPGGLSWAQSRPMRIGGMPFPVNDVFRRGAGGVVLGRHAVGSTAHGPDLTVEPTRGDLARKLAAALGKIADDAKQAGLAWTPGTTAAPAATIERAEAGLEEGHIAARLGSRFTIVADGQVTPLAVPLASAPELRALLGLRDTARSLLAAQAASAQDTPQMLALRAGLNERYDAYASAYGPLNRFGLRPTGWWYGTCLPCDLRVKGRTKGLLPGRDPGEAFVACPECTALIPVEPAMAQVPPRIHGSIFRHDPNSPVVYALEQFDPQEQTAAKAPVFAERVIGPRPFAGHAESPDDAVAISLDKHGEIRLDEVARLLGVTGNTARSLLGTRVFEDPEDGRLVPGAEYLSGLVRIKLRAAEAAAADDPRFDVNVAALREVIPAELGPADIKVKLGAGWIPATDVEAFLRELLEDPYLRVEHPGGQIWTVSPTRKGTVLADSRWGTVRRPAYDLAEDLAEQRSIAVYDTVILPDKRAIRVFNLDETLAAQAKGEELAERFAEWAWEEPARCARLVSSYNDLFNGIVLRSYDGIKLTLPGLSAAFKAKIHDHQYAAVARIVAEPAALLAHAVGAGKTAEMIMGVMELARMSLIRTAIVTVPNHMLEQFAREWMQLYPQAKIMTAGSADLRDEGRRRFMARCATGNLDAVIISGSAFERIPMSLEVEQEYRQAEIDKIATWIQQSAGGAGLSVKRLEAIKVRMEKKLAELMDGAKDPGLTFEMLGCDYIVADEAHRYKNLRTFSVIRDANIDGSKRATDLHMKLEWLRECKPGGRVVTFATATPIANSITEAYVMNRYLRPDILAAAGCGEFDSWIANFGQVTTKIEMAPEGGSHFRQKARLRKFVNIPEALRMFHVFADVKLASDLNLPVPLIAARPDGRREPAIVTAESSEDQEWYFGDLGERAELIRQKEPRKFDTGEVDEDGRAVLKDDNMLWVSTDGRMAALDGRMVGLRQDTPGKLAAAADNVTRIWQENPGQLQIVFCDMGTPRPGWNAYDELAGLLAARGMPRQQVRFMHDAKTDRDKAQLFAACRAGHVAVIIGSTEKMGVGTNVQDRAIALHHIDAPWRPADIEQREGRILRQGNGHAEVQICRYVTLRSFDGYMWQTLERKAFFIGQWMKGRLDVREIEDISDAALSYEEVKAIITGNPLLLESAEANAEKTKLERAERAHERDQKQLGWTIARHESDITGWQDTVMELDAAQRRRQPTAGDQFSMQVDGLPYDNRADAGTVLIKFLTEEAAVLAEEDWGSMAPYRENIPAGHLGGFAVTATLHAGAGKGGKDVACWLQFAGLPLEDVRLGFASQLAGTDPSGLVQRLEHRLAGIEHEIGKRQESIARAGRDLAHARDSIGAPFPHAEALAAARQRCADIDAGLETAAREDEARRQSQDRARREQKAAGGEGAASPARRQYPPQITGDVREALAAARTEGRALRLPGQLDRRLYERVDTALQAAGGQWDRRARAHMFPGPADEALQWLTAQPQAA